MSATNIKPEQFFAPCPRGLETVLEQELAALGAGGLFKVDGGVHFNGALQNLGQKAIPMWIGVAPYSNHAITYDLQGGFEQVRAKYGMPAARAASVVVYRTLNTGQIVYDYRIPTKGGRCQEYLFTPDSGGFQIGMQVNCYMSLAAVGRAEEAVTELERLRDTGQALVFADRTARVVGRQAIDGARVEFEFLQQALHRLDLVDA